MYKALHLHSTDKKQPTEPEESLSSLPHALHRLRAFAGGTRDRKACS